MRQLSPRQITIPPGLSSARVHAVQGTELLEREVRLAYRDLGGGPVVLLIHGSPGSGRDLARLAAALAPDHRVLLVDLPGFGASERELPDYSARAHAAYVEQLLAQLRIDGVHAIGFSLGGVVALELYRRDPARLASVTLLCGTGVQELELLGGYRLNHVVHDLQLAMLWGARELLPHFGALDGAFFGVEYARNFHDTDQRPIRGILESFEAPMLIVHGKRDPLVPPEAAREHHRLVPQSELIMLDGGHFLPFLGPDRISGPIRHFIARVVAGEAVRRTEADPDRVREAGRPFDPSSIPAAVGPTLLILMIGIAAATFVSEDLTCIAVGLLVAEGRIGILPGTLACFVGIYVGDLGLFLAGRLLGRPVVRRAPFRWLLRPEQLHAASRWFQRRGPVVIGLSRFMPGARLPTYVAAGVLHTRFLSFSMWFLLAAAVWTPLLVGLSAGVGSQALVLLESAGFGARLAALATILALVLGLRIGGRLLSHDGRRRLLGSWRRWTRWEFWPPWLFYPPVVAYVLWLGLRHRSPTLFTAANPAMPAGGFVGESKSAILAALERGGAPVARFRRLEPGEDLHDAIRLLEEAGLAFPIVVKPDAGERGRGVAVIRSRRELQEHLGERHGPVLMQEHISGRELGIFYYRLPGEERGRIFSITDKRMPTVTGDGVRTLARLILDDPRAVILSTVYFQARADRLQEIPASGDVVPLVEIGTHCRGAVFRNGSAFHTPALEEAVDRMSRGYEGFHFGRYDIRAPSEEAFREGRHLRVLELNGVTSESTDIYDPANSLIDAYRVLFRQWRLAFSIGAANRTRGVRPTGPVALARLVWTGAPGRDCNGVSVTEH